MKTVTVIFAILTWVATGASQVSYHREVERWRADHVTEIAGEDGWLTVAGLYWLKDGENSIGAGDKYDIALTENFKQGRFGSIELHGGVATLKVEPGVEALIGGKQIRDSRLISDEEQKQTVVTVGSQSFYVIKRQDRLGVRIKDRESKERRGFRKLNWYPIDPRYRINATFVAYDKPKEVLIPNVLGGSFKMVSPGLLKFKYQGRELTLEPVEEDDKLFIIFRDLTSKTTTYGSGRFLYAKRPVNGKTILDFNKAENPSCAFTPYATCPLPPAQNRLDVAIPAGEKRYHP